LWDSLSAVYRQCAVSYTDLGSASQIVFPKKNTNQYPWILAKRTNPIERFNNTMRQRISHLVRKTLSFYEKLSNPSIGAIWYFIHEYNARLSVEQKT
jgi:IS1 family transposase